MGEELAYIMFWVLLPQNLTISADVCWQQLKCLVATNQEKLRRRCQVLLQHYDACPHSEILTKSVIQDLGWEILPPSSYSLTDFYFFSCLSNNTHGNYFDNENALKIWLDNFWNSKPVDFLKHGMEKLLQPW